MNIFYIAAKGQALTRVDIRNELDLVKKYGTVITENFILDDLNKGAHRTDQVNTLTFGDKETSIDKLSILKTADVVIADISTQSTETGICISQAISLNIPTLCLSSGSVYDIPHMVFVNSKLHIQDKYRDLEEFEMKLRLFLYKNNKSPKIVVLGHIDSGKSVISASLSKTFGMVHINLDKIIREIVHSKTHPYSFTIAEEYNSDRMLIPDNLLRDIVMDQITQSQCISKGFILDGYPATLKDLYNFKKFYIVPQIVFHLESDNESGSGMPSYAELTKNWFGSSLNIKIDIREQKITDLITHVEGIIQNFIYGNHFNHASSYNLIHPLPLPDHLIPSGTLNVSARKISVLPTNTITFDFTNHQVMVGILYKLLIKYPNLQSDIRLHPIHQPANYIEYGTITSNGPLDE